MERLCYAECEEAEDAGGLIYVWLREGAPIVVPTRALADPERRPASCPASRAGSERFRALPASDDAGLLRCRRRRGLRRIASSDAGSANWPCRRGRRRMQRRHAHRLSSSERPRRDAAATARQWRSVDRAHSSRQGAARDPRPPRCSHFFTFSAPTLNPPRTSPRGLGRRRRRARPPPRRALPPGPAQPPRRPQPAAALRSRPGVWRRRRRRS